MRRDDSGVRGAVVAADPDPVLAAVADLVETERFGARLTIVAGATPGTSAAFDLESGLVAGSLPESVTADALADAATLVDREMAATVSYGEVEVFVEPIVPRPRLIIFGAVHIAQALSAHAGLLGYHVTVSDARAAFLTEDRFPGSDELLVGWPDQIADRLRLDRGTSVVVLSHDARFERPLWPILLSSPVRFIGAMGSRRTAERRRSELFEAGFDEDQVGRIHGPVGLDIGSDSPGEVAIAILAQMIATHRRPDTAPELVGEIRRLVPPAK